MVNQVTKSQGSLLGKTLYIPRMSIEGVTLMAAAYRALGVNGQPVPESDDSTLELARKYTIGEECYPEIVTLGGFLKVVENPDFNPESTAFLMPTAGGPCRFGHIKICLKKFFVIKVWKVFRLLLPPAPMGTREWEEMLVIWCDWAGGRLFVQMRCANCCCRRARMK